MNAERAEFWFFDVVPAVGPGSDPLSALLADCGLAVAVEAEAQDRLNDRIRSAIGEGATRLQAGFPARIGGAARWLDLHLGLAAPAGAASPIRLRGMVVDGTTQRLAAERSEAVQRELSHRIKNIMAVVAGLIALAARGAPEAQAFANAVRARVVALACIYRHVEPGAAGLPDGQLMSVQSFLADALAPYAGGVGIDVQPGIGALPIGRQTATALALIIYELATNATKHGALATPTGTVRLCVSAKGESLLLHWTERGGPPLPAGPGPGGFGTAMSDRIAATLLGSHLLRDWQPGGLVATLSFDLDRLAT